MIDNTVKITNIKLISISHDQLLSKINRSLIGIDKTLTIATPNAEQYVQADGDPHFASALRKFNILLPESGPYLAEKLVAWIQSNRDFLTTFSKFAGIDVVRTILSIAQKERAKVLIIGGRSYADADGQLSADKLGTLSLSQIKCYWTEGYADVKNQSNAETTAIKKIISQWKPKIIFVAFGAPFQEQWIVTHQPYLTNQGVAVAMAVGGSFDIIFGKLARAPQLMRTLYLEWLFRLIQEPWRWKRQLRLLQFAWMTLKAAGRALLRQRSS